MIQGIKIVKLKQVCDERGKVMHMLRCNDKHFDKFGEIYFSVVNPGKIKGWHRHKKMCLNYAVPVGKIKLVLYDDRKDSPTKGEIQELLIGEESYCLIKIPPMIWNGFQGVGARPSYVANCATIPHSPKEIERLDSYNSSIPYKWDLKHG